MGIRNGRQYLDSVRDERRVYIDGELVKDVTADPRPRRGRAHAGRSLRLSDRPVGA